GFGRRSQTRQGLRSEQTGRDIAVAGGRFALLPARSDRFAIPVLDFAESAMGSASKLTATLLSPASKIPKWKILLVIWTRPTTMATTLAASRTALARVANFARSGTSAVFREGSERT